MTLLSKDAIVASDDIPSEDVDVPEWGGAVRVRGLSGTERDAWEARAIAVKRSGSDVEMRLQDFRAQLVARCLVDEQGERIFDEKEVRALGAKSAKVIARLFDVARRLSGLDDESLGDAQGNSEAAQSEDSTSD